MQVATELVPAGVWSADATHSSVGFEVEHMGVSIFEARFTSYDAEVVSGSDGTQLRGTVQTDSVDIRDEVLRAHVIAPDFLDAERHPELRFESSSIELRGDELVLRGALTIKGTTKEVEAVGSITAPVGDPTGHERFGLTLATTVDRTEFGLDFQIPMPDGTPALGNDVALIVSLELVKGG